ncbi:MAG: efflux RND transporter periplasmic adaptor subunit [Proteobacteria bacterium]|nr:efflux RND transporter periplasmic adaptor subunit [Pseudomonadota bacterium]
MRRLPMILIAAAAVLLGIAATFLWTHYRAPNATGTSASGEKALYWFDPMVPDKHFDAPGKSPFMDMQLVPKYAGGANAEPGTVEINPRQVQNLGVRTAPAEKGALQTTVRATGSIAFDERAVSVVQSRVPGIVEQLHVRAPLTQVSAGQPLLTLLAPDWTAAQEEYLSLQRTQTAGLESLRRAARQRLLLLGMSEAQIRGVERSGQAQTRVTLTAPRAGVIGELGVRDGATVMAGAPLMRINGLDDVWINAAIPEAQRARVAAGARVSAQVAAFPGETFDGEIEAVLPEVDAATRTQTARIVLKNPHGKLAPGMYASVEIASSAASTSSVLVPTEAVIATGLRNVLIVDAGDGHFRAQEVRLGDEAGGKTAVLDGVKEGDRVVLSGQFLIDSEASLTGTLARLEGSDGAAAVMPMNDSAEPAPELHLAQGTVRRIDGHNWTIDTDAIASLDMGAMTMTFVCPQNVPTDDVRSGRRVSFSFFRNPEGAFEIAKIAVIDAKPSGAKP